MLKRTILKQINRLGLTSLAQRIRYDLYDYAAYAYGIYYAARQAKALAYSAISLLEFGVAGGTGLMSMEQLAAEIGKDLQLDCRVFGFDLGTGLRAAKGYKDVPFLWKAGMYRMDEAALRKKLKRSDLIIGDV